MSDRPVIETAGLWKRYDDVEALRGLDLQVPAGSIFGFLGRNGAGKTTTIKVLLGMARPTKGEARVFGLSPFDPRPASRFAAAPAFVSDEKDLYDYMTVGEIVAFTRSFYPNWRADLEQQYLRKFELAPGRDIKGLSRGTRTKAGAAAGALPRRRAADARRADVRPRSGDGGRSAAGARQPRRRAKRRRSSSRRISSPKSSRSPITWRSSIAARPWCPAPSTICARSISASSWSSTATRRSSRCTHRARTGCSARAASSRCCRSGGGTAIIEELRGYRPSSIDVSPVTLKDIFLESVRTED